MKNAERKKCKARQYQSEFTCVQCNLTWPVNDTKPECRPHHTGDKMLLEIRKILKS